MLDEATIQTAGRTIIQLEELQAVIAALAEQNIDVMVLKGAVLAETVYEHCGQRHMGDVDLLLKKQDEDRAGGVLRQMGYGLVEKSSSCYIKERPFQVCIDLGHKIPYIREERLFWEQAVPAPFLGSNAFMMGQEETVIYLCYHLMAGHGATDNKWREDIDRFIRRYRGLVSWDCLVQKIKTYRLELPCYFALQNVKQVFDCPIPEQVLAEITPRRSWRAAIFRRVAGNTAPDSSVRYFLPLLLQPGSGFHWALPSREFMRTRYKVKPPLLYLYYVLRPLQLAGQVVMAGIELATTNRKTKRPRRSP